MQKPIYFCDHKKNVYCKKTVCLFEGNASTGCACFCTTDPAFALRDQSGNPIVFEKHRSRPEGRLIKRIFRIMSCRRGSKI